MEKHCLLYAGVVQNIVERSIVLDGNSGLLSLKSFRSPDCGPLR